MTWYQRKGNKYSNTPQTYNGRNYHSKKEAQYAFDLDLLVKAGEVLDWSPQFKLSLDVNGIHICNYFVDFWVLPKGGGEELHEVKGFETDVWRMKWKLVEALYSDKYKLVVIK